MKTNRQHGVCVWISVMVSIDWCIFALFLKMLLTFFVSLTRSVFNTLHIYSNVWVDAAVS